MTTLLLCNHVIVTLDGMVELIEHISLTDLVASSKVLMSLSALGLTISTTII